MKAACRKRNVFENDPDDEECQKVTSEAREKCGQELTLCAEDCQHREIWCRVCTNVAWRRKHDGHSRQGFLCQSSTTTWFMGRSLTIRHWKTSRWKMCLTFTLTQLHIHNCHQPEAAEIERHCAGGRHQPEAAEIERHCAST